MNKNWFLIDFIINITYTTMTMTQNKKNEIETYINPPKTTNCKTGIYSITIKQRDR